MATNYIGERWKAVEVNIEHSNTNRIEVSNFGRIRSFNKISDGKIVEGSMINGYKIIRLKFYAKRAEDVARKLLYHQKQIIKFEEKIKLMKENKESKTAIKDAIALLKTLKQNQQQKLVDDLKSRCNNYHSLVHRLVATYFLKPPTKQQTIVAHLDYDKLNNRASNLKWMTQQENVIHQRSSPYVIADLENRRNGNRPNSNTKLTVTKVMLLKKLLNEGKSLKALVKQFKITDTQILRIKRGENWGDVPAAK
jgi:hypothetical protein